MDGQDGDTLEDLEGDVWGQPPAGASRLVQTVHRLRSRPLGELTPEDLRVLIGQGVGLTHLVPVALGLLARDPLAEGDFYPGDLLTVVVRLDRRDYWASHPDQRRAVERIARSVDIDVEPVTTAIRRFLETDA